MHNSLNTFSFDAKQLNILIISLASIRLNTIFMLRKTQL